jgi:hypothetical protein
MRLELFPFRYRDPLTGKWVRMRYVAERHEIEARFAEYEILGPVEVREVDQGARYFRYFSPHNKIARSHLPAGEPPQSDPPRPEKEPPSKDPPVKEPPEKDPPVKEPPVEAPATLDGLERFLLIVFLRRYVTYCARRRRFAAMNGATRLFAELKAPATGPLA